jgi:hypothetical protein
LRALKTIGRYVWLPTLVLVAIDLAVPEEQSVLRSSPSSANYTILHAEEAVERDAGDHMYFGIEDTPGTDPGAPAGPGTTSLGAWTGEFDASLAEEADAKCWSPSSIEITLAEASYRLSGAGNFRFDPADCSVLGTNREIFLTVFGERRGGRVSLRLRDTDSGDMVLTFDGLIMPERLYGWFYLPDARPASGPVSLRPHRG